MTKVPFSITEDFNCTADGIKYTLTDTAAARLMSYFTKFSLVRMFIVGLIHIMKHPEHYKNVNPKAMEELAQHCKAFASYQEQNG